MFLLGYKARQDIRRKSKEIKCSLWFPGMYNHFKRKGYKSSNLPLGTQMGKIYNPEFKFQKIRDVQLWV